MATKSPIDQFFFELYGYYPPKPGSAYEMIVAAAIKLLYKEDVGYNEYVKGAYSGTTYQLDGIAEGETSQSMIEAKDYSLEGRKVGRGDLQKMQGALSDLTVTKGIFASATDFTGPAIKYASSSGDNPAQKLIDLLHIRPSVAADGDGRLKKITIRSIMKLPDFKRADFEAKYKQQYPGQISPEEAMALAAPADLTEFYDENGVVMFTIKDFVHAVSTLIAASDVEEIYATWIYGGIYLKNLGKLYALRGLTAKVPIASSSTEIVIESDGHPRLYIKSADGKVDNLINEEQLKKVRFENGKIIL